MWRSISGRERGLPGRGEIIKERSPQQTRRGKRSSSSPKKRGKSNACTESNTIKAIGKFKEILSRVLSGRKQGGEIP